MPESIDKYMALSRRTPGHCERSEESHLSNSGNTKPEILRRHGTALQNAMPKYLCFPIWRNGIGLSSAMLLNSLFDTGGSYEIFGNENVGQTLAGFDDTDHNVCFLWVGGKIAAGVPRWRVGC
jgi:hypothetical protein